MSEYTKQLAGNDVSFRNEEIVEHQQTPERSRATATGAGTGTATAIATVIATAKKTKQSTNKIANKEISENYHNLYLYISNVGIERRVFPSRSLSTIPNPIPIPVPNGSAQMSGLLLLL